MRTHTGKIGVAIAALGLVVGTVGSANAATSVVAKTKAPTPLKTPLYVDAGKRLTNTKETLPDGTVRTWVPEDSITFPGQPRGFFVYGPKNKEGNVEYIQSKINALAPDVAVTGLQDATTFQAPVASGAYDVQFWVLATNTTPTYFYGNGDTNKVLPGPGTNGKWLVQVRNLLVTVGSDNTLKIRISSSANKNDTSAASLINQTTILGVSVTKLQNMKPLPKVMN